MVKTLLHCLIPAVLLSACTMTEFPLEHTNPLDRIYDDGGFRLMLTGENVSSTASKLTWGEVYVKELASSNPVTSEKLKLNGTSQLLYKSGSPTTADVTAVKGKTSLSGYTGLYTLSAIGSGYAGTYTANSPQHKGTYIIQFNYSYKDLNDKTTTGTFYSNFVVIE